MKIQEAVNRKTHSKLAISLAKYPGTFGVRVHNAMIRHHNIDAEYQACSSDNLAESINLIRKHNIAACSVSMPFKIQIMPYLDCVHNTAMIVGAVNTVINDNGFLTGYNTDLEGARWASSHAHGRIALLGNGGMSRAFQAVLENDYTLITRDNWHLLDEKFDTIINATPIGMLDNCSPVEVYHHQLAIDSVVKITKFVKLSKHAINGIDISLRQAAAQYKIYFQQDADISIMQAAVKELYDQ